MAPGYNERQSILQPKDPRYVMDDLVWFLMSKGRPLTIVDDIRPIFRVYTGIGGHVSGSKQAESYVRPSLKYLMDRGTLK